MSLKFRPGFYGQFKILEPREIPEPPPGWRWREADCTPALPIRGQLAGFKLLSLTAVDNLGAGGDPFILLDRWGNKLAEWDDDRIPCLTDLIKAVEEAVHGRA